MSRFLAALPVFALAAGLTAGVPPQDPNAPPPAKGSPAESLLAVQVDPGLKVAVWASEPLMQNPVAFCFDERGRAFVAETNRLHSGVTDTRGHMYWLDDDLACRSVDDLKALFQRQYPGQKPYVGFEKSEELVRLVWDSTGAGKADKSSVFAGGFNRPEDGIGAGVLARKGSVYYSCIPALYRLKDTKGENKADVRETLSTGYGVRVQFLGHDLHGLRMGPDGKLYFSIGDRGLNVVTKDGRKLYNPDSGAVLRCDPDGSHLEIVHVGLRNPQELAFDDHGNLFTYDNNSDSGDRARWVYIVEGGDSGWRCGYQYGTAFHTPGVPQGNRGPWNTEKIWAVPGPDGGPPAYVVPPLAHFGNGPSGITHYPGVGLNDKYRDHFFACDFTSNASNSVIWSVAVKPKGAGFEVTKPEPFVRGMVPTDCEFGPDGAFYWSDWVGGWGLPGKGRIFRLTDPEAMKNPAVAEAKKLLAEGFEKRSVQELAKLLEHPHQQVRLEAQWELAGRKGDEARPAFEKVAANTGNRIARLHAVWGLGMVARKHPAAIASLARLLGDGDAEVRAQAVKVLGDVAWSDGPPADKVVEAVTKLFADPEPRVRYFAVIARGKISEPPVGRIFPGSEEAFYGAVFSVLKANNDADAYVRHAAVHALASYVGNFSDLWNAWAQMKGKYNTPAVRLGVVLALRRLRSPHIADFLGDGDPTVATEIARAIHDERIEEAMPKLAAMLDITLGQPDAVNYRVLSANFKLGTPEAAARIARFAARPSEASHARVFALKLLGDWPNPPRRDHVTGLAVVYPPAREVPPRPAGVAADALKPVIAGVFSGSDAVRAEAARVSTSLGIKEVGPLLATLVRDAKAPASARADALFALASLKDPAVGELTAFALAAPEPRLRAAGLSVKAKANPDAVLKELPGLLKDPKASLAEKQAAFAVLGGFKESEAADKLLDEWLTAAIRRDAPPELLLDIVEAASARAGRQKLKLFAPLRKQVEAFEGSKLLASDNLAAWAESFAGGDAEKGRDIFLNNSAVYCQRCHRLDGQGGDVGPALNGIAAQPGKDRRYLLESVVLPSAKIAQGFETVILTLADGRVVSGVVKAEDKRNIRLVTPENKEVVVPVEDVESRRTGPSAMPDDLHKKLTRRELRDLVEFLASLKDEPKKGGP